MVIMVCGGAGFIGSHFIDYIFEKYPSAFVVCFDKLTYAGKMENIQSHLTNENFAFVKGDICNQSHLEECVEKYGIDTIVNFAAQSHVDRSFDNSNEFLQTNVLGVNCILEVVKKLKIKRFHQVSTDEVYGDIPLEDKVTSFTESSPIAPSSAYSVSKASADLLVLAMHRTFNLPVTVSRCGNNYGTRQHEEKLIPLLIKRAINNQSLPLYGNGLNVRDWIDVYDHCVAIDLILQKGRIGEVYNVGANNLISNLQVAKEILKLLDKPESLITFVKDRPGHDLKYSINCEKIKNELGFCATGDFISGLQRCINQLKNK